MGESFENLKVWQKAHELMLFVHKDEPGIDINVDRDRVHFDDDDLIPDP
jgi:hypothetical protein